MDAPWPATGTFRAAHLVSLEFLDIAPAGKDRMLGRLDEAGFVDVRNVGERMLVFGRIEFHQARRSR